MMSDPVIIKSINKYDYKSGGTRRNKCKTAWIGSPDEL